MATTDINLDELFKQFSAYTPPPETAGERAPTSGIDWSKQDIRSQDDRIQAGDAPEGSTQFTGSQGRIDVRPGVNPEAVRGELQGLGGDLYDETDLYGVLRNTGYDRGRSTAEMLRNAGQNYDQRRASDLPGAPGKAGVGGAGGAGSMGSGMDAFLAYLQARDAKEGQFRQSIRDMLLQQLGVLQQPLTADSPGIRDVLTGQRAASQRAAERSKAQAAEDYASKGLRSSGGLNVAQQGITQQRGEADTRLTGQLMQQELGQRRSMLQSLLMAAINSGDTQSAQMIQAQLAALQAQMQQGQFNDQMGFNYNSLNQSGNIGALMAFLNQFKPGV